MLINDWDQAQLHTVAKYMFYVWLEMSAYCQKKSFMANGLLVQNSLLQLAPPLETLVDFYPQMELTLK